MSAKHLPPPSHKTGGVKIKIMDIFDDKRPVYIFAFGEFDFQQVNVGGIQRFLAQGNFECRQYLPVIKLNSPNANI